jgi:glycosyltransferase involved in cell wall biosynthesis
MSTPRVSVILPVFNRAATIRRCVDSVRAQAFSDWRLVVTDDASTDETVALIESYGDARIRVLRHERNRGAAAARNTAMRDARGEFLAWIDSDDEWLPEKLARQVAWLDETRDDACACDYFMATAGHEHPVRIGTSDDWRRTLHTECRLAAGSTLLVRRAGFEKVGPLDEALRSHEDWDWCLRLTQHFRLGVVPEVLARIHYAGPRDPRVAAECDRAFFAKHAAEFAHYGAAHVRRVEALHHGRNVVAAFSAGEFRLGAEALARTLQVKPLLPPTRYLAFALSFLDGVLGTRLIAAAERVRSLAPLCSRVTPARKSS